MKSHLTNEARDRRCETAIAGCSQQPTCLRVDRRHEEMLGHRASTWLVHSHDDQCEGTICREIVGPSRLMVVIIYVGSRYEDAL